ncbi:MAG: hypothetical protein E6J91_05425 [Deltaproteobacteria bacterium]|nr:MAG: hypothetical protein E6J91_05425 [Deltaproteobacteria bacterium]
MSAITWAAASSLVRRGRPGNAARARSISQGSISAISSRGIASRSARMRTSRRKPSVGTSTSARNRRLASRARSASEAIR